ncbi:alginate O-acetyltransferase AlgX-related protein [Sulfitobacter sp.]|uniref:alginate O-acetyltransferase AlgX-related protein n=1 Tax=Sulfitobacter sp. TaxID=1903071 RepID=UPI003001791F
MIRILTHLTLAASLTLAVPATAAPYCADLNVQDQLPKKYQKRGPFYSDVSTGWIIGKDQLKNKYAVTSEAIALWKEIKAEFDNRGANLIVMAAPPRPLFAPGAAIDAMDLPEDLNLSEIKKGFSDYITALNAAGIVAPDLSVIAQGPAAEGYYFTRDTHWTPQGAALSAAHLNASIGNASVQDSMARITNTATYEEKGSLAGVVKDACGNRPKIEVVSAPQYAQQGSASSLLGDAPIKDEIALIGTSFSDRYQRDAYQVADALAFMMDASVDNFSVTGGGMVGSMETFIRSGALKEGNYQTVVWETPYSAPLTHVDGLRQILGALQTTSESIEIGTLDTHVGDDWVSYEQIFSIEDIQTLEIETKQTNTGQLVVEFIHADGKKTRTKMGKTDRIAADLRSNKWAFSLKNMSTSQIVRIKLRLPKASRQETAVIHFFK